MTKNRRIPDRQPQKGVSRFGSNQPLPPPLGRSQLPKSQHSASSAWSAQPIDHRDDDFYLRSPASGSHQEGIPPHPTDANPSDEIRVQRRHRRRSALAYLNLPTINWPKSWLFWSAVTVVGFSSLGFISAAVLLKIPVLPNCTGVFWPTASASLRLHCAHLAAEKQTVNDLLKAISLVNSLPKDHPLRPELNRNIEEWSLNILDLAGDSFNQGKLEEAIATARKIPKKVPAYELVDERIQAWEEIWAAAEEIYQEAEAKLRQDDFRKAFSSAIRLLWVENDYWKTTKYQELSNSITTARRDSKKLAEARLKAKQGGLSNLLAALELVQAIDSDSYLHQEAQQAVKEFADKMLTLAETTLDQGDSKRAISIVRQIPAEADLQAEVNDFINLGQAQARASQGETSDLEAAILKAQRLGRNRPLYSKAQRMIRYWQLEIQDVSRLEWARRLAGPGTIGDLTAAITEAQEIPRRNPRWQEAQQEIDRWETEIETIEDRPYLTQAERLAAAGDVASLQVAIEEARNIRPGRALYQQARRYIGEWTDQFQTTR
ncbi:MAG: chromosome segregation ATPase, partial [Cyanothece sp. SIO1E1]|nr:chromosome segregation ATPase [Cyanothece sp. SIO1E1]